MSDVEDRRDGDHSLAAWPPSPEQQGVELKTQTALLTVLFAFGVSMGSSWLLLGSFQSYVGWSYDLSVSTVIHQLLLPSGFELVIWLVFITALGWWSACGLRPTPVIAPLRWSVFPIALVAIPAIAACASIEVSEKGLGLIALVFVSLFLAALVEEVIYRGFLLHALSRSRGGAFAVLVSSVAFALAHVPSRLGGDEGSPFLVVELVLLFGFGVLMCRIRVATGSIWWATGYHAIENFLTTTYRWQAPGTTVFLTIIKFGGPIVGLILVALLHRSVVNKRSHRGVEMPPPGLSDEEIARAHAFIRGELDPGSEVS